MSYKVGTVVSVNMFSAHIIIFRLNYDNLFKLLCTPSYILFV